MHRDMLKIQDDVAIVEKLNWEKLWRKIEFQNSMDDSPFRQTLELKLFISTAGKSILNLVKL